MGREKNRVEELIPEGLLEIALPFIEFLKKYYEFMEQDEFSPSSVINRDQIVRNTETTSRLFLQRLYGEVGSSQYINKDNLDGDVANLLKNTRILYEAKGSLESVKVLFRIIFGEDVDVYLPRDFILKPSDGNWDRQFSIMARLVSGDPFDIVGQFVEITSQFPNQPEQKIQAEVIRVESTANPLLYEVFISKYSINVFFYEATLILDDVEMTIEPITDRLINQRSAGTGFSLSQTYEVTNWTRNVFGSYVTPNEAIVLAGTAADSGDSTLDLSSVSGISVGDYIFGDSALPVNTTVASIVDSDTITLSTPLIAPIPTTLDRTLEYSRYPDSYNTILQPYFQTKSGNRRITSTDPLKVFDLEPFVSNATTDGLKVETITRTPYLQTNVFYDEQRTEVIDRGDGKLEYRTFADPSVYPAPDITTNWDTVINELVKISHGESDGSLYSFFTTNVGSTATSDSAATFAVTLPAGSVDSAAGDSGSSALILTSVDDVAVGYFLYGDSAIQAGTTISTIFGNKVTLSSPLTQTIDSAASLTAQPNIADSSFNLYLTDTSSLVVGDLVEGVGLVAETIVASIVDSAQVILSKSHNGYASGITLDVNNYMRGDINHDSAITIDDAELLTRRLMSEKISDASLKWIMNIIEGPLTPVPSAANYDIVTNQFSDSGGTLLNFDNTEGLQVGFGVSGTGISANTTIASVDSAGTVTLTNPLTADISGPSTLTIGTQLGQEATLRPTDLSDSNGILSYQFQEFGFDYPTFFVGALVPDSGEVFSGIFQSTPVALSEAAYTDIKGHLSNDIKLQDGDFYQDFSYVVKSNKQISEWSDLLDKTVHPAGMKVFGELLAGQNISISSDISVVVDSRLNKLLQNQFSSYDSDFKLVTLDNTETGSRGGDSAVASDSLPVLTIGKAINDEVGTAIYYVDLGYTVDDFGYFGNGELVSVYLWPPVIDLTGDTRTNNDPIYALATLDVKSTGELIMAPNGPGDSDGTWASNSPSTIGSDFEVRFTETSGTFTAGSAATDTWLSLSSDQLVLVGIGGFASKTCTFTVEIRDVSTETIQDSASFTLTAISGA